MKGLSRGPHLLILVVAFVTLAAIQGCAGYEYQRGLSYETGRNTPQNSQLALVRYRSAAEMGSIEAQYKVLMYYETRGIIHDYQDALKWYRLAAASGIELAKEALKRPEMISAASKSKQFQEPYQSTNLPTLIFNSSTLSSDGSVELSGRVTSSANISEVSINGRLLEMPLAKDGSFKVVRRLPMGMTTYRLSVVDEFDQRADAEINVERVATQYTEAIAPLDPRKMRAKVNPNAVALIIGVESYSNLPQAQYADSDANHFYDYAHQALGVPTNKIKLLIDAKASRIELLKAMRSWLRTEVADGKSDVYIFFAGHGLASADGSKTYLLPADGDRDLLDETSILRDDLIASAKGAKTITMFLDTCYSGGTRTKEILLTDARPIAIVPDKSALPSNVTVLAAASGAQLSSTYEAAQQGLFSYWLMKGLEGDADTNQDKKITAGELHDYVAKQVGPMAQRRNRQQDPQLMGDSSRVLVSY
ncbi:MAG: caspase family protein [Nitrosospira sp.]|nr:caspase family protein [Nitrosospira sp.]